MNDAPTAAMPTSAPFFGRCLPKKRIRTNEIAGTAGMIQPLFSTSRSALQLVGFVEIDAVRVAVDQQHDGQPDPDLGGRNGDDEQREDLAGDRAVEGGVR